MHSDVSLPTAKQSLSNGVVRISLLHWYHSLHMAGVSRLGAYHGVQYGWAYLGRVVTIDHARSDAGRPQQVAHLA